MLASQFLSVEMEKKPVEEAVDEKVDSPKNDDANNNIWNNLSFKNELPSVLLSECTIELCRSDKKKSPELRFEASLSPSKKRKTLDYNVDILPCNGDSSSKDDSHNIEELLQGVEAVYSGDEESLNEEDDSSSCSNESSLCPYCGRLFYRNCSLALHVKWHCCKAPKSEVTPEVTIEPQAAGSSSLLPPVAPVKAYVCDVCGKSYSHKSVLKKHSVIHTGERLKCPLCTIVFTQRSSLLRHCKRIHKVATLPG